VACANKRKTKAQVPALTIKFMAESSKETPATAGVVNG
jgi:hypothetical protein